MQHILLDCANVNSYTVVLFFFFFEPKYVCHNSCRVVVALWLTQSESGLSVTEVEAWLDRNIYRS